MTDNATLVSKIATAVSFFSLFLCTLHHRPQFQPIELVWRHAKNSAAANWRAGRSITETYADLCKGFYGGERHDGLASFEPIDKKMCGGLIEEAEGFMDEWIKEVSETLTGTVDDLTASVDYGKPGVYSDGALSDEESDAPSDEENCDE